MLINTNNVIWHSEKNVHMLINTNVMFPGWKFASNYIFHPKFSPVSHSEVLRRQ